MDAARIARRWLLGLLIADLATRTRGCVIRISFFTVPDPTKFCMSHSIVEQVTGCEVEWIKVQDSLGLVRTVPSRENCERTHSLMGCARSPGLVVTIVAGYPLSLRLACKQSHDPT